MNLGEFKKHIESFEDGRIFNYSISNPFSWRGSYNEVAFSIEKTQSSKQDILTKIESALSETFYGYKGGEYYYDENTSVNFEEGYSSWSDGEYALDIIAEIENTPQYKSNEEKLIKLAFN